jgi:hypothetical protein
VILNPFKHVAAAGGRHGLDLGENTQEVLNRDHDTNRISGSSVKYSLRVLPSSYDELKRETHSKAASRITSESIN